MPITPLPPLDDQQLVTRNKLLGPRWAEGYYEGRPKIMEIDIRMFKNEDAMMMALLKGEIDTIYVYSGGISYYNIPQIIESEELGYMLIENTGVPAALWMNQDKEPYDDVRFREALSYAIDYEELVTLFTAGYGRTPTAGFIPNGSLNYVETRELSFNSTPMNLRLVRREHHPSDPIPRNGDITTSPGLLHMCRARSITSNCKGQRCFSSA